MLTQKLNLLIYAAKQNTIMNNFQTITISILAILVLISYFGTALTKKDSNRLGFIVLWLFTSAITLMLTIIMTISNEQNYKKAQGTCPEYQKLDNIYKLKQ